MLRILRSAAWISCLAVCVVCAAFWPRSFYWRDSLYRHLPGQGYWGFVSEIGRMSAGVRAPGTESTKGGPIRLNVDSTERWQQLVNALRSRGAKPIYVYYWGFAFSGRDGVYVAAPHWFLVLLTGVCAVAFKPKPRLRLSLLDLVVGMTLGAIALAGIATLARSLVVDP